MSFILEALKKAESERHLTERPGIHTRQTMQPASLRAPGRWLRPGVLLPVLGLATVILCALAWQASTWREQSTMPSSSPIAPVTTPAVMAPPAIVSTAPARDALTLQTPRAAPVAAEILVPPAMPKPAVSKPAVSKPVMSKPVMSKPATAAEKETLPNLTVKNTPAVVQVLKKSVPAVAAARVIGMADLPPAIQRELPPLAISGSMYSANPPDRMLLLDKRMLHEGDEIVAGLILETILQKGAILRYKGYQFQINR